MIEVKNLNKSFGEHHVLKNVNAQFHKGQVNIIIGQSGSGKTVLTKCMVGLFEVDSGVVEYDGQDFSSLSFQQKRPSEKKLECSFREERFSIR